MRFEQGDEVAEEGHTRRGVGVGRSVQTPVRRENLAGFLPLAEHDEGEQKIVAPKSRHPHKSACSVRISRDKLTPVFRRKQTVHGESAMTNLQMAAASGNAEAVREALAEHPDLNVTGGPSGFTALLFAVAGTDSKDRQTIVEMLHAAGADLEKKDLEKGLTPLHYTGLRNKPLIMQALLKCGAKVNATEVNGATALHGAVFHGNLEVCKILVQAGADPMLVDKHGYTPMFLAERGGDKAIIEVLKSASPVSAEKLAKKPDEAYLQRVEESNEKLQPLKEHKFEPNAYYEARVTWNKASKLGRLALHGSEVGVEFSISFKTNAKGLPYNMLRASGGPELWPEDVVIVSCSKVS